MPQLIKQSIIVWTDIPPLWQRGVGGDFHPD
jgi:hypothetical protein